MPPAAKTIKAISVDLEVMTPDRLKKIIFGLDKSTTEESVEWTIDFRFLERAKKTDEFGDPIVKLSIAVKKPNHDAAEETAVKGLNARQSEHLLGPALVAAQRLEQGETTEEKAAAVVERTLPKRRT
jgi:hypothetical protein